MFPTGRFSFMLLCMMKHIHTMLFALCLFPQFSYAGISLCPPNQLQVDFMEVNATANARSHKALVHGILEMPTPNYTYGLVFDPNLYEGNLSAVMTVKDKNPGAPALDVITPLEINRVFDIPYGTTSIFIEIVKNFNWGPEYFKGDLRKFDSFCLEPDVFRN